MLFHKSGPQVGQSRGFAFVTYKTSDESISAIEKLNGKLIGGKNVIVRLAKNMSYDEIEKPKPKVEIPVLAAGSSTDKRISKQTAIQVIEAKLKALESNKDDFEINKVHATEVPLIQKFRFNKETGEGSTSNIGKIMNHNSKTRYTQSRSTSAPYSRNNNRKNRR